MKSRSRRIIILAILYTITTVWVFAWLYNDIVKTDYKGWLIATMVIHYVGIYILMAHRLIEGKDNPQNRY